MKDTQAKAKEQYRALLENTLREIARIDRATPYSPGIPGWWSDMAELGRSVRDRLNALDG